MRKAFLCMSVIICVLSYMPATSTALTIDGATVYDENTGWYWARDLSAFTTMTYSEKISAINETILLNANNITYDHFHMATHQEMVALWANSTTDIISTFMPSYEGSDSTYDYSIYYYGVYDQIAGLSSHEGAGIYETPSQTYNPGLDYHSFPDYITPSAFLIGAWAVTNSNAPPAPVPEPATIFLIGTGIVGLLGAKKAKKTVSS